ncbi:hypothetical protein [Herbaspirillum sp. NPDC087042]|uniref:hypothetical protein n=1 Tax=Herbaspirillum sp. NPDC087042 TaxID=3364004 RepID=UPI003803382B
MRAGRQSIGHHHIGAADVLDHRNAQRFELLLDLTFALDARHDVHLVIPYQPLGQPQHRGAGAGGVKLVIQQ